jgi:maleate isomerase
MANATRNRRLGIITPSSNTNVEPTTYAMLAGIPGVTAHFSRFGLPPSLEVTIGAHVLAPAAELLAEAAVDVLVFHGTAGSWTGVEAERELCRELERRTGIPATTATLATIDALRAIGAENLSMVFPGAEWITRDIATEYGRYGLRFSHVHWTDRFGSNLEMGALSPAEVEAFVTPGIVDGVDAVAVIGTNLAAAPLVDALERRHDVTIVDSTAATTWQLLRMAGVEERPAGWGRFFQRAG